VHPIEDETETEVRKKMSSEFLLSNIIPFAGSGLVGYVIGFALKKTSLSNEYAA